MLKVTLAGEYMIPAVWIGKRDFNEIREDPSIIYDIVADELGEIVEDLSELIENVEWVDNP
ncbi:MAG: hypothetical protein HF312_15570 [Ignavibacteria bacterium]|nr:hypothetical protein [Ignavibacteria bacterium]